MLYSRSQTMSRELTEELYRSLEERHRPEEIAEKVAALLGADVDPVTRKALAQTIGARRHRWSGMSSDFARPSCRYGPDRYTPSKVGVSNFGPIRSRGSSPVPTSWRLNGRSSRLSV